MRNGRSNASLVRRTLTCANPGREESWSDVAVAILAKLWRLRQYSSGSTGDGSTDTERRAERFDVRLVHLANRCECSAQHRWIVLLNALFDHVWRPMLKLLERGEVVASLFSPCVRAVSIIWVERGRKRTTKLQR